jgi:outer membrane lipoprotein-sorting protein
MQTSWKVRPKTACPQFALVKLWIICIAMTFATMGRTEPAATDDGLALAQQVYDRRSATDASSKVVMILQGEGKESRERVLYNYALDKGNSERWTLLRFVEPENIAGTGLLTLDYKGDESDQWLYLPALDRVRRISSSRKGGRFVGSDFYYEDLMDREVDMDHHRLLGKEKIGDIDCDILESIPVDPDNSVYSKRLSWIDPNTLMPLRVDFYENDAESPAKRLQADKISLVQNYWTVFESTMVTLDTGHQTHLLTTAIVYDQNLPESLFSLQGLADDTREKAFRPPASGQ